MRYRRLGSRYGDTGARHAPALIILEGSFVPLVQGGARWRPPADVFETPEAVTVRVEAAGLSEEDFALSLYEDTLVIEGVRPPASPEGVVRFHLVQIRSGPFRLEVSLPCEVERDNVSGRYEDGLLEVTLPKAGVAS